MFGVVVEMNFDLFAIGRLGNRRGHRAHRENDRQS
jgi:hypothetical protein